MQNEMLRKIKSFLNCLLRPLLQYAWIATLKETIADKKNATLMPINIAWSGTSLSIFHDKCTTT